MGRLGGQKAGLKGSQGRLPEMTLDLHFEPSQPSEEDSESGLYRKSEVAQEGLFSRDPACAHCFCIG